MPGRNIEEGVPLKTKISHWNLLVKILLFFFFFFTNSHGTFRYTGIFSTFTTSVLSVQLSLSRFWLFATPWTAACLASLSITNSWSSPKLMSIELVMTSDHLILPSIFPSIRVFSNKSALCIGWPKYWRFSFNRSDQISHSVVSDSLRPHESQQARPPCPSPTPRVHSDSRPSSQWCHSAISSSVVLFSSCLQSLPASESFPMSQLFAWGGQSTRYA